MTEYQRTKVFAITEKDLFKFIAKLNDFYGKNNVVATQTFFQKEEWVGIVYYKVSA